MRALIIPLIIVVLLVPLRAFTIWDAEVALKDGAQTQRIFRDFQYQRTRLGLLQVDEETAVRMLGGTARRARYVRSCKRWGCHPFILTNFCACTNDGLPPWAGHQSRTRAAPTW
jgi:hypothetical protein